MNSAIKLLLSMRSVVILLLIFGAASGVATFIENDFGIETSWAAVYDSTWFEVVQILLGILLVYNIFRYKMYRKDSIPSFLFHIGFLFILVGSGMTRYYGFEGSLHVREGKSDNRVVSSDPFVRVEAVKDEKTYGIQKKQLISSLGGNNFSFDLDVDGDIAKIKFKSFIKNATEKMVDDPSGLPALSMVVSSNKGSEEVSLFRGESKTIDGLEFIFDAKAENKDNNAVFITVEDGKFFIKSPKQISWFKMAENSRGVYEAEAKNDFTTGKLYTIESINFAPKYIGLKGKIKVVEDKNPMAKSNRDVLSALVVDVEFKGEKQEVVMYGKGKNYQGYIERVMIGNVKFAFEWGSMVSRLPFLIKLNEFQLERYPGSKSPMSYASEIEVVDAQMNVNMPYRVYMNHVLDYRGYRFFQSSYDQDEKGTILSVNKDPGKWPTYIGYILLGIGLFFNLVNPKSRFRKLASMIQRDMVKIKSAFVAIFVLLALSSPTAINAVGNDEYLEYFKRYDKTHADNFAKILTQSADGRIKPIDTVVDELLNKVYRKTSYQGLSANQVVLGMMSSPGEWQTQPMINVFHPELKKILGLKPDAKYASFNDFFDRSGTRQYKLTKYADEANLKKPANRNQFDKDVIKVDERVNVCYLVYTGEIFRIIPKINDASKRWFSPKTAIGTFPKEESDEVRSLFAGYFEALGEGVEKNIWTNADKSVEKLMAYQQQYASDIIPSPSRVSTEIFFNKAKIFQRLTPFYLLSGLVLLFFIFAKMLKPNLNLSTVTKIVFGINLLAFLVQTAGLGLRWYISMHAPWSDGYESMIYISWAIALSGIFFSRQSIVSLALTSILAGVTLFVAHLSWMDPQITTLVPVLKSYWLNIHVSVITASYGFLGLCSLLGFFTLILFALRKNGGNSKRDIEIDRNIVEATRINEMSMILGLSLLTIGNFLGGVWANESWGRYWGWDPKETWSLVSILIYAAVAHMRFVPKINSLFAFAVASTISFASIIMTYFGVNFYLSGMHSYASGDPVPIPSFVYYTIVIVFALIAFSYRNRNINKTL
ncbi:MAG: cytochrome c biogenesis protein CcsA [Sulfurospirillaceae bacterium]|nr:cytochrome c biogenesis protein CcsA [Sulfurospirillaceae bacterium]